MQQLLTPARSLIVPVYRNEAGIDALVEAVQAMSQASGGDFEAIFVVDGSPDASLARLRERLPTALFASTLVSLSRNFGAFAAIREGLNHARGRAMAVMAADLQEPPELALQMFDTLLTDQADVVFGVRTGRDDPTASRLMSSLFWRAYRRWVNPDIPVGGVDIFAVSAPFRERLLAMNESNSSLLAQLFWLGGRRATVEYRRAAREHGTSAWTLSKKLRYLMDSVFAFTDLPVRVLIAAGLAGLALSTVLGGAIVVAKLAGWVSVPGYAAIMLGVLFFGAFNSLGLGIVGNYAWRAYENTKARPLAVVQSSIRFNHQE